MLETLKAALASHPPHRRYLVGVSGGRDSVVLLHALQALGYQKLIVCHVNHLLRGAESDKDAEFVAKLAGKLGYTLDSVEIDVTGYAESQRISIELAARSLRQQFFAAAADEHQAKSIFLAHHADDQAETVLFNALRGTGITGLGGMKPETELDTGLTLLRPMLTVRRSEIDAYAKANRLKWREDSSNATGEHTRNQLRNEILPALNQAMSRDVAPSLVRLAAIARNEDDLISSLVNDCLDAATTDEPNVLQIPPLIAAHVAVQHRAILKWLRFNEVPGVSFETVDSISRLLTYAKPARVNLPDGLQVRRKAKTLRIDRQDA